MGDAVRPCFWEMGTDFSAEIYTNRGPLREDTRNGHYRLCDDVLFGVDRSSHSACPVGAAACQPRSEDTALAASGFQARVNAHSADR